VKYNFSDCLGPQYTISGLIASMTDKLWYGSSLIKSITARCSFNDICAALGYDPHTIPKLVESVHKVHAAANSVTSVDFYVLVPSSFQSEKQSRPMLADSPSQKMIHRANHTDMSPEMLIPPLFYAMGGRIPGVMLERVVEPRQRWGEDGEVNKITLHNTSLP
jgi:hypothetical protein